MPKMRTCAEEALAGLRMAQLPRLVFSYRRMQSDTAACSVSNPRLIVLAVVRIHLAASGKQSTAMQTLKAMIRILQVRP
jgi:hypothetical protein